MFWLIAAVVLLSAVAVVVLRNPMYSALFLVLNLLGVAALFALLEAHFLATVQVVVYAGAIMVLVLFVLMLLNTKLERFRPREVGYIAVCGLVVAGLFFLMLYAIPSGIEAESEKGVEGTTVAMGRILFTEYVYPFEIASVLIMTALVGAVMLARRRPSALQLQSQTRR